MKQTLKMTILMVLMTIVTLSLASCNDLLNDLPSNSETTPQDPVIIGGTTTPEPEVTTPEPDVTTAKHWHIMGDWVVVKEATCVEDGVKELRCTGCDHVVTSLISAVGEHTMGNWNVTVQSTCTDGGLKERECQKCGYIETKELDNLSHIWSVVVTVNPTSCSEDGYQESVCSRCGEHKFVFWEGDHAYTLTQWGICTVCGEIHENHEHIIKDGKCQYCDFVLTTTEVSSVFDNDGDGQNEVYLFAPALPEKFTADGVIYVDAVVDNLSDNIPHWDYYTADILITNRVPYDHVYLEKGQNQYLLYTITVEEAGVYEMALHLRLRDIVTRGATYIINEGTENEYSFQTSYGWENTDDALVIRNNDKLIGTYMFGIYVELQAGENTIKITETELAKTQHFRDFYFVKVSNIPCETHSYYLQNWVGVAQKAWGICTVCGEINENHEHIIKDGKCQYCDFVLTTTEVSSVFDNDGDGQNEVYLFAAALPEKFTADGVIHVDAVEDNLSENSPEPPTDQAVLSKVPYLHAYLEKGKDQYLLYTITVEEAGVYEMALHLRLRDIVTRGATYIINEGTENEYSFQTSYGWENTDDALVIRNNNKLIGTYMFGIYVELQAGENTIKIVETELYKTQHFRDFYFVKVEE